MTTLAAGDYSVARTTEDGLTVIRLEDASREQRVSIAPGVGNNAYEFLDHGKNVFYFPYESLEAFAERPRLVSNPLLWPWANRLEDDGYPVEGKRYALNPELGNFGRDGNQLPIHGLLQSSNRWEVVELTADDQGAEATSRLVFHRYPDLAAQFPFAHTIEMTYRLSGGRLEVRTTIRNESASAMPVMLGYHPYFQVHDAPREEWTVHLAARAVYELSEKLTPTGRTEAVAERFPQAEALRLTADVRLDHVFGDLVRGPQGLARFSVAGAEQRVDVFYGKEFPIAVVYAPGRPFVCFEPMTAPTNAMALTERGQYDGLPLLPPGETWRGSYFIQPSGF